MDKEQNQKIQEEQVSPQEEEKIDQPQAQENNDGEENINETSPEDKIKELEDKLTRTFAEMENQRRRFEKEKEDAFEYGGFAFAKEALSLIDNFERSKNILESDEKLKGTDALEKTLEHFDIIHKDIISIFKKK